MNAIPNNMKNIQTNLQYIQRSILNNTYKEQRGIIVVMIQETITAIKDVVITLEVPCVADKANSHLAVITSRVKKAKASMIASLEDLDGELQRNKVNTNCCVLIIQNMLDSSLYMDDVYEIINNWKGLARTEIIQRTITVK